MKDYPPKHLLVSHHYILADFFMWRLHCRILSVAVISVFIRGTAGIVDLHLDTYHFTRFLKETIGI